MSHSEAGQWYRTLFEMVQHHGWSLGDLYESIPFERDAYAQMIAEWLAKKRRDRPQA